MDSYKRNTDYWDKIFSKKNSVDITSKTTGQKDVDYGLHWLCNGADSVLDFGCGNGSMLFKCKLRGSKKHTGIDISSEGIRLAKNAAENYPIDEFDFKVGEVNSLNDIPDSSFDGVILSNIVDNLIPEDSIKLLVQIKRILKQDGKIFIKLNPYITKKQIKDWNIKIIKENFLDDGLFLWNLKTCEWEKLLCNYFSLIEYRDIYYHEYNQYNRLFLMKSN